MFISFVFAEIFLRLFICLLCAVPWNAHNAPSSRVSLYHCIWNLKSNRHLTPPSLRLLRPQWAINMPALLVLPHMAHQGYSMLTWVCKLCIFYLNNVDLYKSSEGPKHSIQPKKIIIRIHVLVRQWPLSYINMNIGQQVAQPLLTQEMRVKRKSGHLTPVTVVGSPSIALMRNSPSHLMPWSQECTHQTKTHGQVSSLLTTIFT